MLNVIVCKINLNEHIWNTTGGGDGVGGVLSSSGRVVSLLK